MFILAPSNLQIQCKSYEDIQVIFHRTRTNDSKICMEPQKKTLTAKVILENLNEAGGIIFLMANHTMKL